jgi:hypothetical protein
LKPSTIILFVLVILMFQFTSVWVHGFQGSQIADPLISTPVTIDGNWTSVDEWSDAVKVSLTPPAGYSGTAYLYAKHDASTFYFLIDFVSATTSQGVGASVSIDSAHDGGDVTGPDDMRFDSHYPYGGTMAVGTGGTDFSWGQGLPAGVLIASSMSISPNSATPHEITEFKIPYSVFPQMQNTIGFAAAAYVSQQLPIWPSPYYRATPSTWGELTLSQTPIPEFGSPAITASILLVALTTTILTLRKMHR